MTSRKHVLIIGGGLSGLAAAVALAEDFQITVVERKPFLGGRASSYPVPGSEQDYVDNCQHVLLKSCTNLIDFYQRIGAAEGIVYFDRITFIDKNGRSSALYGSPLPVPFHLLPSLLRFRPLHWKDKVMVSYAFFCMLRQSKKLPELDQMTMMQWLRRHHQTDPSIETFWRPILVSALNEDIEVASARYALKVFLDGMLRHRSAYHIGIPSVPLSKLYTEPTLRFLERHEGKVLLRAGVKNVRFNGSCVGEVILSDGTAITADYYISSTTPETLTKLLPEESLQTQFFSKLRDFETSPITAIYFWFDKKIFDLDCAALLGREMQWIFNKSLDSYVGLVVSASRKLLSLDRSEIIKIALTDVQELFPAARDAKLLRSVVIKEPFATFSCRRGCDAFRPDQKSPMENFFIAGDWTQTGWPATMEGAVRSGYRCAELIQQKEGKQTSILVPDLEAQGFARLFQ